MKREQWFYPAVNLHEEFAVYRNSLHSLQKYLYITYSSVPITYKSLYYLQMCAYITYNSVLIQLTVFYGTRL